MKTTPTKSMHLWIDVSGSALMRKRGSLDLAQDYLLDLQKQLVAAGTTDMVTLRPFNDQLLPLKIIELGVDSLWSDGELAQVLAEMARYGGGDQALVLNTIAHEQRVTGAEPVHHVLITDALFDLSPQTQEELRGSITQLAVHLLADPPRDIAQGVTLIHAIAPGAMFTFEAQTGA